MVVLNLRFDVVTWSSAMGILPFRYNKTQQLMMVLCSSYDYV